MSGSIQYTFYTLNLIILGRGYYFSDKLRQRKFRAVTQDHVASKWERQGSNPEPGCKAQSLNSDTKLPPIVIRRIK